MSAISDGLQFGAAAIVVLGAGGTAYSYGVRRWRQTVGRRRAQAAILLAVLHQRRVNPRGFNKFSGFKPGVIRSHSRRASAPRSAGGSGEPRSKLGVGTSRPPLSRPGLMPVSSFSAAGARCRSSRALSLPRQKARGGRGVRQGSDKRGWPLGRDIFLPLRLSPRTRRGTVHNPGPLRINELHAVSSVMAKREVKLAYARGSRGVLS